MYFERRRARKNRFDSIALPTFVDNEHFVWWITWFFVSTSWYLIISSSFFFSFIVLHNLKSRRLIFLVFDENVQKGDYNGSLNFIHFSLSTNGKKIENLTFACIFKRIYWFSEVQVAHKMASFVTRSVCCAFLVNSWLIARVPATFVYTYYVVAFKMASMNNRKTHARLCARFLEKCLRERRYVSFNKIS